MLDDYSATIEEIPEGTFKNSGTNIKTYRIGLYNPEITEHKTGKFETIDIDIHSDYKSFLRKVEECVQLHFGIGERNMMVYDKLDLEKNIYHVYIKYSDKNVISSENVIQHQIKIDLEKYNIYNDQQKCNLEIHASYIDKKIIDTSSEDFEFDLQEGLTKKFDRYERTGIFYHYTEPKNPKDYAMIIEWQGGASTEEVEKYVNEKFGNVVIWNKNNRIPEGNLNFIYSRYWANSDLKKLADLRARLEKKNSSK